MIKARHIFLILAILVGAIVDSFAQAPEDGTRKTTCELSYEQQPSTALKQ